MSENKLLNTQKRREKITSIAPGEGQKFDNNMEHQEERCFPELFPTGKGGYVSTYLNSGLGFSNYCKLRLTGGLCIDKDDISDYVINSEKEAKINYERFRKNHHYMMFLLLILDSINMRRAQSTAFRKVSRLQEYRENPNIIKEKDKEELIRRNVGYRTFKNIRGTAPYFEFQKSRLFAFLRQIGPPTVFLTLTSAEFDWIDLMENIIKSKPDIEDVKTIIRNMKNKENISFLLNLENEEEIKKFSNQIVLEMDGCEMSKLVNDHILHTTKDFDERIKKVFQLLKLPGFLDNQNNFKTQDYFIRIEHQQRGAPHAHILLWLVDINVKIEKTVYINGEKHCYQVPEPAPNYKNSVEGKKHEERDAGIKLLEDFADQMICLSDKENNREKVLKYQTHSHSFTCHKKHKKVDLLL